ncbi:hypothetical protein [Pseudomonas versuta]|uniref:hypothetical protein n=1 Tax=Pseudomonas versuta TaxID=1788301 RepID=UPI000A55F42B|nr:hypothetical protein [Pseudomonas versuta]
MKISKIITAAIVLFSFDSLIKITFDDFRIHISHLLILGALLLCTISSKKWAVPYARSNKTIILLLAYLLLHAFIATDLKTYVIVLSYFLLAVIMHIAIFTYSQKINFSYFFKISLLILIITGLAQFILQHVFNFQISLGGLSEEYYNNGGSIVDRMRGLFLEPNWYGLYLAACLIGYITTTRVRKNHTWIILASLICLYLSGNRLTLYFSLISIAAFFYEKHAHRIPRLVLICACLAPIAFLIALTFSSSLSESFGEDRSASARSVTALKTATYMQSNFSFPSLLLGNGLSTWGEISFQANLSSRADSEKSKTARDTSESYVILFELGIIGAILFLLDFYAVCNLCKKRPEGSQMMILASLIFSAAFYYPIFYFMMYLAPYFAARTYCSLRSGEPNV